MNGLTSYDEIACFSQITLRYVPACVNSVEANFGLGTYSEQSQAFIKYMLALTIYLIDRKSDELSVRYLFLFPGKIKLNSDFTVKKNLYVMYFVPSVYSSVYSHDNRNV